MSGETNKRFYKEWDGVCYHDLWEAECPICGETVYCSYPHYETEKGTVVCADCSLVVGLVSEEEFIKMCNYSDYIRAVVHEGKVFLTTRGKFPWEITNKDIRCSKEYSSWRSDVFERDNYTCKKCGQRGGELNAHHIKPFAKYTDDRFDVDNGVTLCKKCHKEVHKENNSEWIHS